MDVELMSDSFQSGECCNYQSHETEEISYRYSNAPDLHSSGFHRLKSILSFALGRYLSSDSYSRVAAICANSNLEWRKFQLAMNAYMLHPIVLVLAGKTNLGIGNPLHYITMDLKVSEPGEKANHASQGLSVSARCL